MEPDAGALPSDVRQRSGGRAGKSLEWEVKWGRVADSLLEYQKQKGGALLPALAERVAVPDDLLWIWEGFWALHGSRHVGWSVGPIPLSEIAAYVGLFGIEDAEMFAHCIRQMDRIWLQKHAEQEQHPKDDGRGKSNLPS